MSENSPLLTTARPLRGQRVPVRSVAACLDTRCDSRVLLNARPGELLRSAGHVQLFPLQAQAATFRTNRMYPIGPHLVRRF